MKRGNNAKIHPRNVYRDNPPNFKLLAQLYPNFARFVKVESDQKIRFDWKDPEALIALTTVLLRHDFGLTVELPADQLCPTVTSRLNYILWIEDLLQSSASEKRSVGEPMPKKLKLNSVRTETLLNGNEPPTPTSRVEVHGIDIGTGVLSSFSIAFFFLFNSRLYFGC
jgi:hypothetical protein